MGHFWRQHANFAQLAKNQGGKSDALRWLILFHCSIDAVGPLFFAVSMLLLVRWFCGCCDEQFYIFRWLDHGLASVLGLCFLWCFGLYFSSSWSWCISVFRWLDDAAVCTRVPLFWRWCRVQQFPSFWLVRCVCVCFFFFPVLMVSDAVPLFHRCCWPVSFAVESSMIMSTFMMLKP